MDFYGQAFPRERENIQVSCEHRKSNGNPGGWSVLSVGGLTLFLRDADLKRIRRAINDYLRYREDAVLDALAGADRVDIYPAEAATAIDEERSTDLEFDALTDMDSLSIQLAEGRVRP